MEDQDIYILEPEPWERQLNESPQAFEAFACYRDMGAARSLAKVSRELCKCKALMERWSKENDWVKRVAAWDAEKDRVDRIHHAAGNPASNNAQAKPRSAVKQKERQKAE